MVDEAIAEKEWVLIDTETTGFGRPIYVVEIGAQRMCGWKADGPGFRVLLNQNANIPPEASRVHGYTPEILERDGESAIEAYGRFREYVEERPIVAYNLAYDLDDVLLPEWERLGIESIGSRGFCALRLAQRLLDPVAAGNCKLQTLRQFYGLEGGGAHTAVGDVETVISLVSRVLKPICEQKALTSWQELVEYSNDDFFPSRIAFGKYIGTDFRDAIDDQEFRDWIEWLASSSNVRTRTMGEWYLNALADVADSSNSRVGLETGDSIAKISKDAETLTKLIDDERSRLAAIEAEYTQEKSNVAKVRSEIFMLVCDDYKTRDQLQLIISYRRKFIEVLIRGGLEEADYVTEQFLGDKGQVDLDYEEAENASEDLKDLSDEDAQKLQSLWKKLVRLFHPDRYHSDPDKKATFEKLTAAINDARDQADLELLEVIAENPEAYIARRGWSGIDLTDALSLKELENLYTSLQLEIVNVLELLQELRDSPDYELFKMSRQSRSLVVEVANEQIKQIKEEILKLKAEADKLKAEIEELDPAEAEEIV